MARDLSNVVVSLQTPGVTRQGFGTPIFFYYGNFINGRTASFSDLTSAAEVFPTDSNPYKAIRAYLLNTPSVPLVKVAQLKANSNFVPVINDSEGVLAVGRVVSITITNPGGGTETFTYTIQAGDDADAVTSSLQTDITASSNVTVTATNSSGVLTLAEDSNTVFTTTGIRFLTFTAGTRVDSIADGVAAVVNADNDWFAVTAEFRTAADTEALGDEMEARERMYFVATNESDAIDHPLSDITNATDALANLKRQNYNFVAGFWHQDAADDFPECTFQGYNLPYDAGSVTWKNLRLPLGVSRDTRTTNTQLTPTQQQNLDTRDVTYLRQESGVIYTQGGRVFSRENIDTIRGRANLVADIKVNQLVLLSSQQGGKLDFTDQDIQAVANNLEDTLTTYDVGGRNFLTDISISVPRAVDVPATDKQDGILRNVRFTARLLGAITFTDITGTLSF